MEINLTKLLSTFIGLWDWAHPEICDLRSQKILENSSRERLQRIRWERNPFLDQSSEKKNWAGEHTKLD
ncbi:hypothetical protein L596_017457 [Steinernema carpocapsae]|uniref:Uncharacterized protein n=1 Tax=Steinernema carpocapsae TaxID=34508 RepID=A0A4U5N202_STECR|nr:hypothetical protein L596_017457 [Steinernema carpocapsae]